MKRSQKIFIGIMLMFFAALAWLAVDISGRTSFPGSRKKKEEKLQIQHSKDSLDSTLSPNSTIHQP